MKSGRETVAENVTAKDKTGLEGKSRAKDKYEDKGLKPGSKSQGKNNGQIMSKINHKNAVCKFPVQHWPVLRISS